MLVLFASTASAQFPGGWGAPQQPKKPISTDPNVRAPKAEVANYSNKFRQVSTSLTYDFNSETCKLTLLCYDIQQDIELKFTMDFADDYGAFAKWVKKVAKNSEKMLKSATDEDSRQRIDIGKPSLRGSIKMQARENKDAPAPGSGNLSADGHFIIDQGIATWELKFSPQRGGFGGGFGGFPGGGRGGNMGGAPQQPQNQPSYTWIFRTLDEFNKLQEILDKSTLSALNKVLIQQGKEMEANYGK